ncbi:MAG: formylmethanofuran dehydrogenase subunit E family protein [Acidobacteriota bacterium]|nr:formylmethanofuran dehydrogenase subunit E family protein [Acidobacteriota bacterium]
MSDVVASAGRGTSDHLTWSLPAWLGDRALPTFRVRDTRSAQGRFDRRFKTVTVADLVLAHGHPCDGLLRGVWAMRALADVAFAEEGFDRSDLLVVSKNSPCLGDVAAYLTGGRTRFGTHRLDDRLGVGFQVQRLSTREAWEVREAPDFFPDVIAAWEADLLRAGRDDSEMSELLAVHEAAQWDWVREVLLPSAPRDNYTVRRLDRLDPPAALMEARRTDTVNRLIPPPRDAFSPDDPDAGAGAEDPAVQRRWRQRYDAGPDA